LDTVDFYKQNAEIFSAFFYDRNIEYCWFKTIDTLW